jgi:hypothetical protein
MYAKLFGRNARGNILQDILAGGAGQRWFPFKQNQQFSVPHRSQRVIAGPPVPIGFIGG